MTRRAQVDPDVLHREAQVAALTVLGRFEEPSELMVAVSPYHRPGSFTPDVAMLELAVSALDLACPPGAEPLAYEGLRERYLPEVRFRGRVEHRNSQYALYAAACMRGGVQPDLLDDAGWWNTPLWTYAVHALLIYARAAAERQGLELGQVAERLAEAHGIDVTAGPEASSDQP